MPVFLNRLSVKYCRFYYSTNKWVSRLLRQSSHLIVEIATEEEQELIIPIMLIYVFLVCLLMLSFPWAASVGHPLKLNPQVIAPLGKIKLAVISLWAALSLKMYFEEEILYGYVLVSLTISLLVFRQLIFASRDYYLWDQLVITAGIQIIIIHLKGSNLYAFFTGILCAFLTFVNGIFYHTNMNLKKWMFLN